jgi:hypothetical protein
VFYVVGEVKFYLVVGEDTNAIKIRRIVTISSKKRLILYL